MTNSSARRANGETRILPHNDEAERAVLGAILLDEKAIHSVVAVLRETDFYSEGNRTIYRCMIQMADRKSPIDMFTVRQELQRMAELEKAGGTVYLAGLTDGMSETGNVEHYAKLVKESAALRQLIQAASEAMEAAFDPASTSKAVVEDLQGKLLKFHVGNGTGFVSASSALDETIKTIEARKNDRGHVNGIDTGLTELNKMTGGFRPGNLIIVAGRPGLGKTALCLNIAAHAALRQHKRVGIFSLEMSLQEVMERILCAEGEIDSYRMKNGGMAPEDWGRISGPASLIYQCSLGIDESGTLSIAEIRAKATQLQMRQGLDLLIVDYLQLASGYAKRYENRTQEVGDLSRGLKLLAKELNIPVIAACQLNREVEKRGGSRKPQLSDLRESGSIENDADLVLFIWREEMANPTEENAGMAEIIIGKQRNGPVGSVPVVFMKQYTKFANAFMENR